MAPTTLTLDVKQREVFYTATLGGPVFTALPSEGRIYGAIYSRFAPLGVNLANIHLDGPAWSPGDVSISCTLHAKNVLVRYRLDRVEVWWGGIGRPDIPTVVEVALGVLYDVSPESKIAGHLLHATFHGEPHDGDISAWLSGHVPRPIDEADPKFMPNGVSFSALVDSSGTGYVLVERSLLIPRGGFVRVTCDFPGRVPVRTVSEHAATFISTSLARFGITLRGNE